MLPKSSIDHSLLIKLKHDFTKMYHYSSKPTFVYIAVGIYQFGIITFCRDVVSIKRR